MSLPYQSRFVYRRRKGAPVPSPYGGFGGPSYTLGSLSNRPGSDWGTPRYVRDEPVMFMAGFGEQAPEGSIDTGEGTWMDPNTGELYSEPPPDEQQPPPPDEQQPPLLPEEDIAKDRMEESGYSWEKFWADSKETGAAAFNFVKDHQKDIMNLVSTGLSIAQAVDKLSGNSVPVVNVPRPPTTSPLPPVAPVYPTVQTLPTARLVNPTFLRQVLAAKFQPKTSATTYLIFGAVAVGAFLLLRKK